MNNKISVYTLVLSACLFILAACTHHQDIPRPYSYPKIAYPAKEYRLFDSTLPFTFRYPKYAYVYHDTSRGSEPDWLNVYFPSFAARIHLSYKDIPSTKSFAEFTNDAHTFAFKHSVKADDISQRVFRFGKGIGGIIYDIAGNTASNVQFFVTDSTKHYIRGSLYFYTRPNEDSLAPVISFLRMDIDTMLRSLKWKPI